MAKKVEIKRKKVAGATSTGKVHAPKKMLAKLPKSPAKIKIKPLKARSKTTRKPLKVAPRKVRKPVMDKAKFAKIAAIGKAHGLTGKPKSKAHKEAISRALKAAHARKRKGGKIVAKKAVKKVASKAAKSHMRGPKPKTKAGRAARGAKVHVMKVNKGLAKFSKKWVTDAKSRKRTLHSVTGKPLGRKPKKT